MAKTRECFISLNKFFNSQETNLENIYIQEKPAGKAQPYRSIGVKNGVADILSYVKNGENHPSTALRWQLQETDLRYESDNEEIKAEHVDVFPNDCMKVAAYLNQRFPGKVALLNMANRLDIGGDVFNGSFAQEEYLCCVTDLAASLLLYAKKNAGYIAKDANNNLRPQFGNNSFSQTDVLYSVNKVLQTKHSEIHEFMRLDKNECFEINIISSAALRFDPNKNVHYETRKAGFLSENTLIQYSQKEAGQIFHAAIYNQIRCAIKNDNRALVLSAFGCGAFKNNPLFIAKIYRDILCMPEFYGRLVVNFAIIDNDVTKNAATFADVFKEPLVKHNESDAQAIRLEIMAGLKAQAQKNVATVNVAKSNNFLPAFPPDSTSNNPLTHTVTMLPKIEARPAVYGAMFNPDSKESLLSKRHVNSNEVNQHAIDEQENVSCFSRYFCC